MSNGHDTLPECTAVLAEKSPALIERKTSKGTLEKLAARAPFPAFCGSCRSLSFMLRTPQYFGSVSVKEVVLRIKSLVRKKITFRD
jgi:hypothetical protein